jgi:hypothetical protein
MLKNQRDPQLTKAAGFTNRKSYRTFAGHWHVSGIIDHCSMRAMIFNQAKGMCQTCKIPHYVRWEFGEWAHPKAFGGKRCDGPCCGKWSCHAGHEKQHKRKF